MAAPSTRYHHPDHFSYKDVASLRRYVSEQGYIVPRSKSGLSMKRQRQLAKAVKRARHLALLPFTQTI
ncbi:MAG: 30S ribosomal protein S18 [Candidatus Pacebacteria bacterium CG10_big_fil_rev_8_21_14_0_10_56_10]|nr:MAG: 30S ribosomal protein S18 [Candidatus Pacebacteria bacterium CG10_big_fil_rev_8_21_14_0_10_56_10]